MNMLKGILLIALISISLGGAAETHSFFSESVTLAEKLSHPLLNQGMINTKNVEKVDLLGRNYSKRNTLNSVWLGLFRRYNSSETAQNRTALDSKRSETQLIFEMDGLSPIDWDQVTIDENNDPNISDSSYALSLETSNVHNPESPILLVLLSNQHVILDYLSNGAQEQLKERGATVAVLEYPGYGASVGVAGKKNWLTAAMNASQFLSELTGRKVTLVGHSIGGPLALETASQNGMGQFIEGVVSYGGFSTTYNMAKDHVTNPFLKFFSGSIVWTMAREHNIDGLSGLDNVIENGIRGLILHGEHDGAVPPRHTQIYAKALKKLERRHHDNIGIETHIFPNLYHEEVNNYSEFSAHGFYVVWDSIYDYFGW